MFPEIGVVALVPDYWGPSWQPRHHVLARLAEYFHVVWVEPVREWRTVLRDRLRPGPGRAHFPAPSGLRVYDPEPWLPTVYRPARLARWVESQRLGHARRLLERRGCKRIVLYLWRPEYASALDAAPFDLSCYHIDDEYSFADDEVPLDAAERRLLAAVDQVFIHSPALLEKKGAINPHTDFVPNGVNYRLFAEPVPEPADLRAIPRPRIGYIGHLKKHLDWRLLLQLARRHPEWSFVFVGGKEPHPEIEADLNALAALPNAHFLGPKTTEEIAAYPQHFDVCTMPYRQMAYTRYIYPLKLHEYLASGQPTVGMRIRSLEEFHEVVGLAEDVDEWSRAIAEALRPEARSPQKRTARQAVAHQHDWNSLVLRIARRMVERVAPQLALRLTQSRAA